MKEQMWFSVQMLHIMTKIKENTSEIHVYVDGLELAVIDLDLGALMDQSMSMQHMWLMWGGGKGKFHVGDHEERKTANIVIPLN